MKTDFEKRAERILKIAKKIERRVMSGEHKNPMLAIRQHRRLTFMLNR